MKTLLLNIWCWLTGTQKNQKEDIYNIEENPESSDQQYRNSIQKWRLQYEEKLKARKNLNVEFVWCLVGNIIGEHQVGENNEIKRGTKHFSPGTKVYCFPPQWGDGYEKIYVMGRPRQSLGFIKVVINSDLVTNWRIQKVFTPRIKTEMIKSNGWGDTNESKDRILILLNSLLKNRGECS
ncbi:MAG TPA: hypothetical protein VD884_12470 [Ohtaekwangia sp.]|nr:hypothetical protein [Ohtaekwangia sp.]